ncbi:nucleotide sugar dehydrogenase [bacterium]|nr:nucleotide sugar dehydrogenase [bacterium]
MTQAEQLKKKIARKEIQAGIIGLGYVGLPLAMAFARAGVRVTGFDVDPRKVDQLKAGESYIADVPSKDVRDMVRKKRFTATVDFNVLRKMDTINICVPTPLRKSRDPDISYIAAAVRDIQASSRPGQLVILESTTYPGTTTEILQPALEKIGRKVGEDVFIAFSPERVDPGNQKFRIDNTPKVVGGITPACGELAEQFYRLAIRDVVRVSSPTVAEMVKLLENTFRGINIGLANEMSQLCHRLKIDVWEVIDAAATKPFGFMPFYPGPGLGGHCIPIDPLYLAWRVKLFNLTARFIELATEINRSMPEFVVERSMALLNSGRKAVSGSKIVILGATYKRDVSDVRESPVMEIIEKFQDMGADLTVCDPYLTGLTVASRRYSCQPLTRELLRRSDLALILTDHAKFDYSMIVSSAPQVFDTRNAVHRALGRHFPNVTRL